MPRRRASDTPGADEIDIDIDAAVDALYADEPDGFIAARDDLARRLRAAGRREDAATVKALRRPTVAAWAVNRVARERADDVADLRALGDDLRRAQDAVLGGGAGGSRADAERLRELGARRRAATSALAEATMAALAARGAATDAHRDDIVGTFDAVAADPSAAEAVAAARLARPLEAPVGLGAPDAAIMAFAPSPDGAAEADAKPRTTRRPEQQKPSKAAAAAEAKRGGRVHVLDAAEVRKARARAAKAHEAADAAAREVARLEAALTTARQEAARAKEAASRADAAARAADAAASRSPT